MSSSSSSKEVIGHCLCEEVKVQIGRESLNDKSNDIIKFFFLCCDRSYNRQFSIYSLSFLFLWKNYTMCHCLSLINTPNGFFTKSGVSKRSDCSLIDVFEKKINQHGIRTWFKTINRTFNKWFFFSSSLSYWTIVFVFVFDWIGWGISIFLFFFLVTGSIPIDW